MRSRREIRGSAVVVVGATSGVGLATALALARRGARLLLVARSATAVEDAVGRCRRLGADAHGVAADIGVAEDVDRIAWSAIDRFGRIDTWINTAAALVAGPIEEQPVGEIERLVRTNVLGTALASRAALRAFRRGDPGVLINVSSLLAVVPNPLVPTYVMSKHAVRGLSLALAAGTRGSGSHVCTVLPGPIDTPLFAGAANHTGRRLRAIAPAQSPERVAAVVLRSVERPRRVRTTGVSGAAIVVGHRILPRLTEAIVAAASARLLLDEASAPSTAGSLFSGSDRAAVSGGWRRVALRRRVGDAVGRAMSGS